MSNTQTLTNLPSHGVKAKLSRDEATIQRVLASNDFLNQELQAGSIIYGVNTGFGGSADTRTQSFELLQSALVQHLNVGLLLPSDKGQQTSASGGELLLRSHALPVPIVRAMMLIRCNSLMRGHSGVRIPVVESILKLLSMDMTPVVPLRGSISASGDLSTLSYIAGALEGNPDVVVRVGGGGRGREDDDAVAGSQKREAIYLPSNVALVMAGIDRVRLQAKEGLGITNGTAASSATACIAIHQANQMAILVQLLTAMGTEALAGTAHNYNHFISSVRPHDGQMEAATNIRRFLAGSNMSPGSEKGPKKVGMAQDNYALRTAPQWIGPQLEDLKLAMRQVSVEINSTTDNPLIDVEGGRLHHGGNFQAMSITSAMEKTMLALQNLGRILFAQSSELINNTTNKGLPPNLSPDDPNTSFLCKGFDVNMAAYMAELGYLAHPVSTHVQAAEMGNQSVNSMAMVSARYALEAVEVTSLMAATYIFILCQALDLRCLQFEFEKAVAKEMPLVVKRILNPPSDDEVTAISTGATTTLLQKWTRVSHLDCTDRGKVAVDESLGELVASIAHLSPDVTTIQEYQAQAAQALSSTYEHTRRDFFEHQTTTQFVSPASRMVYDFVRKELSIPFVRGLVDHPALALDRKKHGNGGGGGSCDASNGVNGTKGNDDQHLLHHGPPEAPNGHRGATNHTVNGGGTNGARQDRRGSMILGTMASEIYLAIRDGELHSRIMEFCSGGDVE